MTAALVEQQTSIALIPPTEKGGEPTTALVKFMPGGRAVRNMLVKIRLSEAHKQIVEIPPNSGNWTISATGYFALNQCIGMSFVTPNPIDVTYDEHACPVRAAVTMVGIGPNAIGNIVAHTNTIIYDLRDRLAQDVMKKWKPWAKRDGSAGGAAKSWGRLCNADNLPDLQSTEIAIRVGIGAALIVDLTHADVANLLAEHVNRQRFFIPALQTMCKRNILKAHIGEVAIVPLRAKGDGPMIGDVSVSAWVQSDWSITDLKRMIEEAKTGAITAKGQTVPILEAPTDGNGDAQRAGFDDALTAVTDETAPQPEPDEEPASVAPAAPKKNGNKQIDAHRAKIRMLCDNPDVKDRANDILGECGLDGLEEVAKCGDVAMLAKAQKALEAAQLAAVQARKGGNGEQDTLPLS